MPPWKLWLRRGIAIVVFLLFLVIALAAAGLLPFYLAAKSSSVPLLAFISLFAFASVAWCGARLCLSIWRASNAAKLAVIAGGFLTCVFAIAIYLAILRPHSLHLPEAPPFENTKYWQLSTGSRIAYSEYDPPSGVAVRPEPIVFIHGGPGLRQGPFDQLAYGGLAADGFRVILYDQAGSGLSGLLPHVRDYTIARAVEDLEAIRQELHANRMILVGHSWGSTLAASYIARYPDHVSKVVFHSPGAIWNLPHDSIDFSRTAGGNDGFPPLRLLAALFLQERNPDTAENLVPQREAEELFAPMMLPTVGTLVCKGDLDKLPPVFEQLKSLPDNPAFNPYVLSAMYAQTDDPAADPHSSLRNNRTPAILLFGECNYLSWAGAVDYRATFPNLNIYYFPRAGHYIQFEQPDLMRRVILAFLLDQPDAIPPYRGDADPRSAHL
jgi:pimeloyl-ACP methyl ester carboxylesterase